MALIGPVMAEYIKDGNFDAAEIDELHAKLRAPVLQQPMVQPVQQLPMPTMPIEVNSENGPIEREHAESEPPVQVQQQDVVPVENTPDPVGSPVIAPTPPEPIAAPLPPAISPPTPVGPPIPAPPVMPPVATIPPPPLAPMPMGPPGIDQPIPLDMPMPEAPRIPVQATPDQEPLISKEEQDALLDELS